MSAPSSNSSGTTMEDLLSESSYNYSPAPSPCSSGSYNPADYPFDNEWEEFRDPSFESAPSSSASFVPRQDSSRLTDVVQRQSSRRKLLRELPWSAVHPYERPRGRIKQETDNVLTKASALVTYNIFRRAFNIPTSSIAKVLLEMENAIGNVSWLIRVAGFSSAAGDKGYLGLPPVDNDEPVLYFMWEQVPNLLNGSPEDQAAAAAELGSLDGKLFIEGGIQPLLNVLEAGKDVEMQEKTAKALGLLGREGPRVVDAMVQAGICTVFTKVLNEGDMKVQAMVAWAISELAAHHPRCQGDFAENNTVQLLVGHLAFETFLMHEKFIVVSTPKAASIHPVVLANTNANANANTHIRGREQDPATKSRMKAMAARALSAPLAKGNSVICKSITETRALLTFAVLLEKGTEEVRSHSAIAVMEIARVAEADNQIGRLAAYAVVNQLLQIVRKAENNDLLVPSIVALGCWSKTFQFCATKTRLIGPLIRLLDERVHCTQIVLLETVIALTKFAETNNYMCAEFCKAIVDEGGVKLLVALVYFEELVVQEPALIILGNVAKFVPDSDQLAELLSVYHWAAKQSALVGIGWLARNLKQLISQIPVLY